MDSIVPSAGPYITTIHTEGGWQKEPQHAAGDQASDTPARRAIDGSKLSQFSRN